MSTITKHGNDRGIATPLGREIRRRRLALGLTQTQLGQPLTRSFVSAVETGRCVPSLPVLLLMAQRLQVRPGVLIDVVNPALAVGYTPADGSHQPCRST